MQEGGPQKDHAGQPAARDALDQPVDRVGSRSCWLEAGGEKKRLLQGYGHCALVTVRSR